MSILLGCIADDFTGATDIAGILARSQVPVTLHLGVPDQEAVIADAPFQIIALKCRTTPVDDAVTQACRALDWLQTQETRRYYWKYCSTFDSTAEGNIGPVAETLLQRINNSEKTWNGLPDTIQTIYCPSFPENGRSVYMGNLFVGEQLLHESPMRHHPLTPMSDSHLGRLLNTQTTSEVATLTLPIVRQGPDVIRERLIELANDGIKHVIVDAVDNNDLMHIVRGSEHLRLLTGGSALALHLPALFRVHGWLNNKLQIESAPPPEGGRIILSGSCSDMTRRQVAAAADKCSCLQLEPIKLARESQLDDAIRWLSQQNDSATLLVYATTTPDAVVTAQKELGKEAAGSIVEQAMATLAQLAFDQGRRQFIVAGGETSAAVANALGQKRLAVGREITPGVPWTTGRRKGYEFSLALKSGNFGDEEFFSTAFDVLNSIE
ncbi:MAG: 3-oxo-tetronate kinase [Granulosicoccus sp.]